MVGLWVLRHIRDAFDGARVQCDLQFTPNTDGQRRTLIEQYYHTVDWSDPSQVYRVLEVYETVLLQQELTVESVRAGRTPVG